jgi:hypothetical protein
LPFARGRSQVGLWTWAGDGVGKRRCWIANEFAVLLPTPWLTLLFLPEQNSWRHLFKVILPLSMRRAPDTPFALLLLLLIAVSKPALAPPFPPVFCPRPSLILSSGP